MDIPANLSGAALLAALAGLGLIVGVLTGLFGVGGGFMVTPLLRVLFGVPYSLAVGSSLTFIIGTSASGVSRHLRLGNVEVKGTLILAGGGMCGATLGGRLHEFLRGLLAGGGRDDFTAMMHGLFIVVLLTTAWLVARDPRPSGRGKTLLQRVRLGPRVSLPQANLEHVSLPGLCAAGMLVGLLTGMLGIGGGVLLMPVLLVVVGLTAHQAVGTSLGVVLMASIAGTIEHARHGHVNLWIAMMMLAGSAVGVQIGAWLCGRLHARRLRGYFAVLVLVVAVVLAADLATMIVRG